MIIRSYEVKKNKESFLKNNLFLLYGENLGLKKDIRDLIISQIKQKDDDIEIISLYESEITKDNEIFYNTVYSGSLFSSKKIITIYDSSDKLIELANDVCDKYPENIFLIFISDILEKKSKLRNFFETNKRTICVPCYSDSEKDLETRTER